MIIPMTLIRVMGRRAELARALAALQDAGTVHLIEARPEPGILPHATDPAERVRRRAVTAAVEDLEAAIAILSRLGVAVPDDDRGDVDLARAAWRAARIRRRATQLEARRRALTEEADTLRIYAPLLDDLEDLARGPVGKRRFSTFLIRLRPSISIADLQEALDRALDDAYAIRLRRLDGGEIALLLVVAAELAAVVDRVLAGAHVETAALPPALAAAAVDDGLPRVRPRLDEIERELRDLGRQTAAMASEGRTLARARRRLHDEALALDARAKAGETTRAFVLEGWVPARALDALRATLHDRLGATVSVEVVARDAWHGTEAPVVLANPPVFAPFERLIAMLPLPRYGSVDPTPFVAVFFPMLFGLIVGDVGYGAMLGLIAVALWRRGPARGFARDLARIAAAVGSYTVIFGVLYGELFGDLGRRYLGMRALWFDREDAILPFLGLAIAIGLVHLVLGLVVGAIQRRGHPREAAGRGLTAAILVVIAIALLAVFELLPGALFTPAIIALFVAFPVLIALEGFSALLELVTTFGHVLSYARVMALGTASVMLAVVANRMHGAFGGAAIGVAFALLFHLVNFAITVFSPTVQVLRLHYVEFFGTFFSPGGSRYQPFARWAG